MMTEDREMKNAAALRLMFQCGRKLNQISGRSGANTILIMLAKDGVCTQRQLIEATGKRSATLSEQLTNMEREGLITRRRNALDKRNVDVELTEAGKAAAQEALPNSVELANSLFSDMKGKDLEKLTDYLEGILRKIEAFQAG